MDIYIIGGQSDGTFGVYNKYHLQITNWSGSNDPSLWTWLAGNAITAHFGKNFDLYQLSWDLNASWNSLWNRLGGNWSIIAPTVVLWDENRIDVFAIDANSNQLYHTYWNGSWQPSYGFESLGGYCTSKPTAISWGSGRIDLLIRGGEVGLRHLSYNGSWSNWTSISGNISVQAEPKAISWGPNRIDVFAWGTDNSLLHKSLDGTNGLWTPSSGFEILRGSLAGPPKGVSDAVGSLHVVSFSRFGNVQHISFNQTLGIWSPEGSFDNLGAPVGGS